MITTIEQLQDRLAQCQAAYDQLEACKERSSNAEHEKATMLLEGIARIYNKIAVIKFSERREAQRAIKAAATIPRERLSA
jgi:hypothetical protein